MRSATGTGRLMRLAPMHVYPVKGFHRVDPDGARVESWGLAGDRRWLVADGAGRMLTQRQEPKLGQLQPSLVDGDLVVRAPGRPDLHVPAKPGELVEVKVLRNRVPLSRAGAEADAWLSAALDREVRLVD